MKPVIIFTLDKKDRGWSIGIRVGHLVSTKRNRWFTGIWINIFKASMMLGWSNQ